MTLKAEEILLNTTLGVLDRVSRYLEKLEDVITPFEEEEHQLISKEIADVWAAVRGDYSKETPAEESKPLDLNKQAEIKTAFGSVLVIGKDQEEMVEEERKLVLGHCVECASPTARMRLDSESLMGGRAGIIVPQYECESCAQEAKETGWRNNPSDGIHLNSQLF
jgi:hypothetical protein